MILNKEEFEKLDKLNSSSLNDGGNCNKVADINKGDKIYVFPDCKIKRLDLRKWIKHIECKQVHKVEQADVCIVTDKLLGYSTWSNGINLSSRYLIPAGNYYYNYDSSKISHTSNYDESMHGHRFHQFINQTYIQTYEYDSWANSGIGWDAAVNKFKCEYECTLTIAKLTDKHVAKLLESDTKIVNVSDIQQVLYEWEVENKVRDSTEDYNWDAIKSLITSDSWELALTMIKKMDVEPILSGLLSCYYCYDVDYDFKKKVHKDIFSRNPKLIESIGAPSHHKVTSWTGKEEYVNEMISNCKNNGISLDKEQFKWIY